MLVISMLLTSCTTSSLQGSKKKNLSKQEMSKYLRFIVQRMKERVRTILYSREHAALSFKKIPALL